MTGTKLSDELLQTGLPDRTQLILALAPGCLFGFPPANLDTIISRVDCQSCRAIMERVMECQATMMELHRQVQDFCRPVRVMNVELQEKFERWRSVSFLGRFVRPPKLKPEPQYRGQLWYKAGMQRVEKLQEELQQLSTGDPAHWGDELNRQASREVVGAFLAKDGAYVLTL